MLVSSATLATFGLAGCLGGDDNDESEDTDEETSEQAEDTEEDETTEPDDLEIAEFELLDQGDGDAAVASIHGDHWHGGPLEVPHDDSRSLGAFAEDEGGNAIEFGDEYALGVEVADDAQTGVVASDPDEDFHGDHVDLHGERDGSTTVVFQIRNDGHVVYETSGLEIVVGDAETDTAHGEDDHEHDDEGNNEHDGDTHEHDDESDHEHDH
ncbi:hypothetical protein HALLA_11015 [Halostagnicola larsenii XH-48]|uniref:Aspartic acid-rich protein n=1 Tax=Halostagnicola larsenii XH-48 TaxID=797299 RepID=W0JQ84_9EURY|nr:hypothetical protein [Halostagnicola larsenii]AHG00881.1 hypothetical protein HALLA_11015 [Halostagnicola larsenii XH-48]